MSASDSATPPGQGDRGTYVHRLQVRYAETDQMGRVHHANYLLYLEEARTRWLAQAGCSYAELEREGIGLPVRSVQIRYFEAALYEDVLEVELSVSRLRGASVTLEGLVRRASDGQRIARGTVELACIRMRPGDPQVIPLPDAVRRVFEG
ncbi:MAG: acyl-CoA thioesterase [Planctomycetota bacterium]|jgi:acyl-CoA thioester hydrolase